MVLCSTTICSSHLKQFLNYFQILLFFSKSITNGFKSVIILVKKLISHKKCNKGTFNLILDNT